ncbi:hypothetical protein PMZ80_004448 [Knufia obscura]|uniref:Major facilitator superfamily (MFS) profile domain-containing protein n=1 Tax=Knufia obscura TaxID=1635080 RepID=A0ABR0RS52_9EURO|nr:hypothetical protein PMZ80_004448 [Knufia obscura]
MPDEQLLGHARTSGHDVNERTSFDSLLSSPDAIADDDFDDGSSKPKRPSLPATNISTIARRPSVLDDDEQQSLSTAAADNAAAKTKDEPVTWMSLPKKGQLAVLTIARLSEPLSERSLAAYMFYQLRWFDPSAPDSTIASQGGLLTAAFAAAQFFTAVWWGRAADTPWIGRKKVLLIGLTGTAIASIGVGFSKTFYQAFFCRALAGALNGNIGVMRTMLSEIIKEKRYQSRAFLLLPMCFNIGVVIGPILGGFLADPISAFPDVFGPGSTVGGKNGVGWMTAYPYALPNLFSGVFILISAMSVVFGLDETHEALRHKPDYGRKIGKLIARLVCRQQRDTEGYSQVATDETEMQLTPITPSTPGQHVFPRSVPDPERETHVTPTTLPPKSTPPKSPFRQILTRNVLLTLTAHHLLALHVSAFNALIFLLLPAPHSQNKTHHFPSLHWTGGLGLTQEKVGLAMAILGIIGLPLQILLYPPLNTKLGTLPGYRTFLPFSIIAYIALPFLVLVPERPAWLVWVLLSLVLASQVLSRTFALTGTVILVNNSSPSPATLGTVHGVAQSASSAARMLGPTVGGWLLGLGLKGNFVGGVWWGMAGVACANWGLLWVIWEGDGRGGRA